MLNSVLWTTPTPVKGQQNYQANAHSRGEMPTLALASAQTVNVPVICADAAGQVAGRASCDILSTGALPCRFAKRLQGNIGADAEGAT
jgi:hypothetical protein